MKRRVVFGLPGIFVLSMAFTSFVVSCHTGVEDITPSAYINRNRLVLYARSDPSDYDYLNSYTLVVTLRPRKAFYGAQIDWCSNDGGIVFVKEETRRPPSGFGENGRATVKIVGYEVGEAKITATVTFANGSSKDLFVQVSVVE